MPALDNLSFEDVGASPGLADLWTASSAATAEDIGIIETFFPGWSNDDYSLVILTRSVGITETFITGWSNDGYAAVTAGAAAGITETFTSGWFLNEDYSATTLTSAVGGTEDFTTGWSSNQDYTSVITSSDEGAYYGSSQVYEDFARVVVDVEFTVVGDLFSSAGHELVNDTVVYLQSTDTLPGGTSKHVRYFVVSVVAGVSFKLSLTLGGAAITTTDAGAGTHNTHGEETLYWTGRLG